MMKIMGIGLLIVFSVTLVIGFYPFIDRGAAATNPLPLLQALLPQRQTDVVVDYIENRAHPIDAFIALGGEKILMEYGETGTPMNLASIRKSVLSLLFGIAWDRGLIELSQTLNVLGIDEKRTPLTPTEKHATIEQLLQSRSGIYLQSGAETVETKDGRPRRGQFAPGKHYFYNNWDFNVLGAIFEKKTGLSIGRALDEWLAVPLGMQDFNRKHVFYDDWGSESGFKTYRIHMSARDLARLGALITQDGMWNGNRVVSSEWLERSTKPYSSVDSPFYDEFGYSWWLNSNLKTIQADGWGGQYLLVDRDHDLTLVTRRDTGNSLFGFLVFSQFKEQGHPVDIQKLNMLMRELLIDNEANK